MNVTLRPATVADALLLHELAHRIWWAHYPAIISAAQIAYMLERMYAPAVLERLIATAEQVLYVVEMGGEALGFLAINRPEAGEYFLHKFYLDTERHRQGIGAAAFQALLEQYPDLRTLSLNVNRRNHKSVNFYFKMGFRIAWWMDTPFGDGYVMDDYRMVFNRPLAVVQL